MARLTGMRLAQQPPVTITERLAQLALDLGLSSEQKRFAEALAADPNADAKAAYIAVTGNEKSAGRVAPRMTKNRKIQRYYRELMEATPSSYRTKVRVMRAWEIRARLSEIARGDIKDFILINPAGGFEFDLQTAIAAGKTHLIKDLSHDPETGAPRVTLHDAKDALKVLAKIEGLMQDGAPPPTPAASHRTLVLNILSQPDARRLLDDLGQRVIDAEQAPPPPTYEEKDEHRNDPD